ncbi:chemotaxis protein CheA [Mesobaculum littorinae]|uniref:Chemotaxis protein CheA n=1 Tax=Mesobaculum littorinae TaxID=2486419 RepID=A0A438AK99_9RHOB|nr:chemotaxis protein CheA [Mesobaculum littorinae]RVV99243.1 chemotaxis protein CheA [Mesobaculum littorinae]
MSSTSDLRDTFFLECEDLLESMSEGLRLLQDDPNDIETVNSVFRAVHSIKGGAGAFALGDLVGFAHSFESVLDAVRSGKLSVTPDLMKVIYHAADHLTDLVESTRDGTTANQERGEKILIDLEQAMPVSEDDDDEEIDFAPMAMDFSLDLDLGPSRSEFRIGFRPNPDAYLTGNDPQPLLRELSEMGDYAVTLNPQALPPFDDLDPSRAYLAWDILLGTDQGMAAVEEVFEFVEGACTLDIIELEEPSGAFDTDDADTQDAPDIAAEPDGDDPAPGAEETATPGNETGAAPQEPSPQPPTDTASTASGSGAGAPPAKPAEPTAGGGGAGGGGNARAQGAQTIRVALDRVDRLINVVGELVIHQAMLTQAIEQLNLAPGSDVLIGLDELKQLSREMQESVMAIRAQPVKPLFQRMFRIVREASEATGKSARLETVGDTTEVDKTVFEKLSDPLTHMIRNAVDHGLENAAKRAEVGKPEEGTVTLSAGHRSGRVVITIADDGGGINRPRVRQIAEEKGLISPEADLTASEIDNLLFLPGFSTAAEVSSLSGRGVGMDVVRSAIQDLGGTVSITSFPGKGTTFTISLPLTLAVLDGMVVDVSGQQMVVPITAIVETLRPSPSDVQALGMNDWVVSVRGSYLPIVDVGHVLGFRPPLDSPADKVVLLIETDDDARAALLVDDIQDHRQVVIKSLEENFRRVRGVAAATVFGDGQVALIMDTNTLVDRSAFFNAAAMTETDTPQTEPRHA